MSNNLRQDLIEAGLDDEAFRRIGFRLNYLNKAFEKRLETLRHGNLASWEPEFALINQNMADMNDVLTEFVSLLQVTMNQEEQGIASPPNVDATTPDAAQG